MHGAGACLRMRSSEEPAFSLDHTESKDMLSIHGSSVKGSTAPRSIRHGLDGLSVRRKTLLIIGATSLVLIGVLYLVSRLLLLGGFMRLEQESVAQDMHRAESALDDEREALDRIAADIATWDKSYEFMGNPNPDFIRGEFGEGDTSTLTFQHYDFLVYADNSGRIIGATGQNPATGATIALPPELTASPPDRRSRRMSTTTAKPVES
jgi:sensor domain CHASE-containing protein